MYDKNTIINASRRITTARTRLLQRYPFFGKLLLHLKVKFGNCGTACTDMDSMMFDIGFMHELNDAQLEFVMLHEVMHCVFKHCIRGHGKIPLIYNIACDMVVNSFILQMLGVPEFTICNESVMHIAPDGCEGRDTTAEKIYVMLIRQRNLQELDKLYRKGAFDSHEIWKEIDAAQVSDRWDKHIRDSAKIAGAGSSGIPANMRRYLEEVNHTPKTNWRQLLQDYIRFDRSDFDFTVPDRRFQDDYLLPSFRENLFGDTVKGLWLFVDASGSVTDRELAVLMKEIYSAYEQVENISGKLSFFDTEVSEPVRFESIEELQNILPVGGGGTSFRSIFNYLKKLDTDDLPDLILVFTDGYANFPDEDDSWGIPVIWLIEGSEIEPPWGNTVYIYPENI